MSPVLVIATGTVTGQVVNSLGQPLAGIPVVAKLNAGVSTPQTISPVGQVVPVEVAGFTDSTGAWSLALVPNNNINPSNTTYTIQIQGMPDVVIQLNDTASHLYTTIAVNPTTAILSPAGQTISGGLTLQSFLSVSGNAKFQGPEPWFDATHLAWGAVGDGVTDDAPAINAALTAAGNAGGGTVLLPKLPGSAPTVYAIKSVLNVPANVELHMGGANAVYIRALAAITLGSKGELIRLIAGTAIGTACRITDGLIDCNSVASSGAIYSERINENSGVYRVQVVNPMAYGIQIAQPSSGGLPQHWTIDDVGVQSGSSTPVGMVAIWVNNTSLSTPFRDIGKVSISGPTALTAAIKLDGVSGTVHDIHIEHATDGILIGSVLGCFGLEVHSVDGLNTVTNCVRIAGAPGSQRSIRVGAVNPAGATNALVDNTTGVTVNRDLGEYILGASGYVLCSDGAQINKMGQLALTGALNLATPALAGQAGAVYQGSGAPNNANGNNGDVYFRTDTPGTANQRYYIKAAGAWTGIL